MTSTLTDAMKIAIEAHRDQVDKSGAPYILHVRRVGMSTHKKYDDADLTIAATLHDVIEGSDMTASKLIELGFSTRVVHIVFALTRPKIEGHTYTNYIDDVIRAGRDAMKVKREDLLDHLRKDTPESLAPRYHNALERIEAELWGLK